MRNSINSLIETLKRNPMQSENSLMSLTFNYNRNSSKHSNKKYADMLRRGLRSGKIARVEIQRARVNQPKFYYYLPNIN